VKRLVVVLFVLVSFLIAACSQTPTVRLESQALTWQPLGNTGGISLSGPAITRQSNNTPVLAFSQGVSNQDLLVKQWNGSTWQSLGTALDIQLENDASSPAIAMRSTNRPIVAWTERPRGSLNGALHVKRWTGTTWISIGKSLNVVTGSNARNPSIAVDSKNRAYVAWEEFDGTTYNIHAKYRFRGAWVSLGDVVAKGAYGASMAVDTLGYPVLAYSTNAAPGITGKVFVKRWNGRAWTDYGTGQALNRNASRSASFPSLALDSRNYPVVAWREETSIQVKRWNGSAWISLGNEPDEISPYVSSFPELRLRSDGNPVVVTQKYRDTLSTLILVREWNPVTRQWVRLEPLPLNTGIGELPAMVLKTDNQPVVAWKARSFGVNYGSIEVKAAITNP
jgi:hypothetical protein